MTPVQPTIGQWYLDKQLDRRFEVVGIDEKEGTIELQDEQGYLDEMDRDAWFGVELELTAQPDDLTDVFDDVSEPDEADGDDTSDPEAANSASQNAANDERADGLSAGNEDEE